MNTYRILLLQLPVIAMMTFATSCSEQARHKTLTVFFTGVPSNKDERKESANDQLAKRTRSEKDGPLLSFHSYFTSKQCGVCHKTSFTQSLNRRAPTGVPVMYFDSEGENATPQLPFREICVNCHANRSPTFASENNLWLHAPATKGGCTICHVPHQSRFPALLKGTPANLCTMCHPEELIKFSKSHSESKDCSLCHTPHLGKDKLLLIQDYKEVRWLPEPVTYIFKKK
ncbi:cytochrome c3 family protein [Desulfosediminicola flagellatus]|uniref:cytochrome c3 family protein n=1 Tax=Desulfosediminicola flagellatus TaxID=2569541 RepID=UPI0010ADA054|nr:cytochrome c3 family protein [Desulfosediminicola flagellatus]